MKFGFLFCCVALITLLACDSNNDQPATSSGAVSSVQNISYSIAGTYPHDTASFTQGLAFYNGRLLEGTGNLGQSKLMQVNLQTGKADAT